MKKSKAEDISQIKKRLAENDLPIADLENAIDFYVEKVDGRIVAVGALEAVGNEVILRSVAAAEDYRSKGFGTKITRELIELSKEKAFNAIYLLTLTAENYLPKFGFKNIDRELAPEIGRAHV